MTNDDNTVADISAGDSVDARGDGVPLTITVYVCVYIYIYIDGYNISKALVCHYTYYLQLGYPIPKSVPNVFLIHIYKSIRCRN